PNPQFTILAGWVYGPGNDAALHAKYAFKAELRQPNNPHWDLKPLHIAGGPLTEPPEKMKKASRLNLRLVLRTDDQSRLLTEEEYQMVVAKARWHVHHDPDIVPLLRYDLSWRRQPVYNREWAVQILAYNIVAFRQGQGKLYARQYIQKQLKDSSGNPRRQRGYEVVDGVTRRTTVILPDLVHLHATTNVTGRVEGEPLPPAHPKVQFNTTAIASTEQTETSETELEIPAAVPVPATSAAAAIVEATPTAAITPEEETVVADGILVIQAATPTAGALAAPPARKSHVVPAPGPLKTHKQSAQSKYAVPETSTIKSTNPVNTALAASLAARQRAAHITQPTSANPVDTASTLCEADNEKEIARKLHKAANDKASKARKKLLLLANSGVANPAARVPSLELNQGPENVAPKRSGQPKAKTGPRGKSVAIVPEPTNEVSMSHSPVKKGRGRPKKAVATEPTTGTLPSPASPAKRASTRLTPSAPFKRPRRH
ncbi:hypothetical protein P7C70_g9019, partial [Phenoliferia sp. Uapishka_3]